MRMFNVSASSTRLALAAIGFLTFGMAPLSQAIVDVDGNGLSDIWESAYGTLLPADYNTDADSDGRTNIEEYNDGTDPLDPESVRPTPTSSSLPQGKLKVSWPTVTGKVYQLQVSFSGGEWQNFGPSILGTGDVVEKIFEKGDYLIGGALISRYFYSNGNGGLQRVKTDASSNATPAEYKTVSTVETPQTKPDQSNFGQWVRGWIIPKKTGKYTFWVASDDTSELWLSPSASTTGAKLIASNPSATNFRQWDKFPEQKSAPVMLTANKPHYFEVFQREGGGGDHLSVAWTGPGLNADKEIVAGAYVATDFLTIGKKFSIYGTPAFRVVVSDQDQDKDSVTDYEELTLGFDPTNPKTISRTADLTSIKAMMAMPNSVTVGAEKSRGFEKEGQSAAFTFFRTGNFNPITVQYTIGGTAQSGLDFKPLTGTISFAVGQTAASIEIQPENDQAFEPAETVSVTVEPGTGYVLGAPSSATITIDDAADIVYVATLRGAQGTKLGGYGTAALRVAGNEAFGDFRLSFGNLSSAQTSAQIAIEGVGGALTPVLELPLGPVPLLHWEFEGNGSVGTQQILAALRSGKLVVSIGTTRLQNEIAGTFLRTWGTKEQIKPPKPGATVNKAKDDGDAARFLIQATFGPSIEDIQKVRKSGYPAWIADQFKKPITKHFEYVEKRRQELIDRSGSSDDNSVRQEAWWQAALAAPDQLRQRVAFALSEFLVVSDVGTLEGSHRGLANYYDVLLQNAFGNYRNILQDVTLSPIMGQYLSMVRNQKPNPDTGSEPDENYAREVMQLMSIGLSALNTDGSLMLGTDGLIIPTYIQDDIVGLAHVFTGWGFAYDPTNPPENLDNYFRYGDKNELKPMIMYPKFHDTKEKRVVRGTVIPAGLTGEQDLKLALDNLFNHPNVGPFVARQLVQRMVTSNPSRGYIYRVASKFNNNGSGVRGDMKAVVRAVLMDPEARNPVFSQNNGSYGKLREPLLRVSHLFRALAAKPPVDTDKRFFMNFTFSYQGALKSPSVFNFFQPGYSQPGAIAANGLFSPEFQITSETSVIDISNRVLGMIRDGIGATETDPISNNNRIRLDFTSQLALLKRTDKTLPENVASLIDQLDVLLLNGQMSPGLRANIEAGLALFTDQGTTDSQLIERIRTILFIIVTSPEYCIQK